MAMHKATPGVHRSLRQIAESKAQAASFPEALPYDAQGGHPTGAGMPSGTYTDHAEQAKVKSPTPSRMTIGEVFKVGRK